MEEASYLEGLRRFTFCKNNDSLQVLECVFPEAECFTESLDKAILFLIFLSLMEKKKMQ